MHYGRLRLEPQPNMQLGIKATDEDALARVGRIEHIELVFMGYGKEGGMAALARLRAVRAEIDSLARDFEEHLNREGVLDGQ